MRRGLLLAAVVTLSSASAAADPVPSSCDEPHDVDRYQLLRRLSLDLRGRLPSFEEYAALDDVADVPASTIGDFTKGDDFRLAMRRYHEAMFWPNVSNVRLANTNANLRQNTPTSPWQIASSGRAKTFRGSGSSTCGDWEETHFDPKFPGEFRPDPAFLQDATDSAGVAYKQEGWRMVTPYWAPTTQVKVCAFDAEETVSAKDAKGVTRLCNDPTVQNQAACGCGPGLRYCYGPSSAVSSVILASLREQLLLEVDKVTTGGRPYTDLLLSTKAEQNGPIAFWKKHLAPNYSTSVTMNVADPDEEVLPLDFTDATFHPVDRKGLHAGVVTLPGYLLRFQTDRGRANRFRINFLCSAFVPPDVLADAPPKCSLNDGDITQRCNCRYCHVTLEPMAAYFGSFSEAGTTQLTDRTAFPLVRPDCVKSGNGLCTRYYVTDPDAHNKGSLLPYQYADVHDGYLKHLEGGPRLWALEIIESGEFARCAVKRTFMQLVRREMKLGQEGDDDRELALLTSLADDFKKSGYDFPSLVRAVVSLPQYRRAR